MDTETRVEILAMNLCLGVYGVTAIRPDWIQWAENNPIGAAQLRAKAKEMIGVAHAHVGSGNSRTSSHHSLGWLP